MGQTVRVLSLFFLSWLLCVLPISSKPFPDGPRHRTELQAGDNGGKKAPKSGEIKSPLGMAFLKNVQRSMTKVNSPSNTSNQATILKQIIRAYNYLKQYNYISHTPNGNRDIKTALESFQRYMHLPVTGLLDNTTLREMQRKRCGVPDVEINDSSLGKKRFAVTKKKWTTTTLYYAFETYTADMTVQAQKTILAKAFKMWSDVSPLKFILTTDLSKANIKIMFGATTHGTCKKPFDGQGNVLAHAFYPSDGRLHFDDDEYFTDGSFTGTNLLSVAMHEIGHTLGLAHSTVQQSVMYPVAQRYVPNLTLSQDDKDAIKYLYAGGTSSPGSSVCLDVWLDCANLSAICTRKQYRDFMNKMCRKTCNFCD